MPGLLDGLMEQVARDLRALPEPSLRALRPILVEAEGELERDLHRWLTQVPGGATRFTSQMYRNALVQIRGALDNVKGAATPVANALETGATRAGVFATRHLNAELLAFAEHFQDSIRPLPLHQAAILAEGKDLLIPRHRTSAARYVGQIRDDIRAQLALGVVRGETIDQLTKRLVAHGGPRGMVALRGVIGQPNHYAELISEGLFRRYGFWAERLARTEVLHAYNVVTDLGLKEWAADDEDALSRWDAAADYRLCAICRGLHDRTVPVGGTFPGGYKHPPAHPNCRCALTAWNKRWGNPAEALSTPPPTEPAKPVDVARLAPKKSPALTKF